MRHSSIHDRAHGRWKDILAAVGVPRKYLSGRHCPCPVCGGKDRFRFDDKNGSGSFYCNNCGAGRGVKLVMLVKGVDFKEACKFVEAYIGTAIYRKPKPVASREQNCQALRNLCLQSNKLCEGDLVWRYLVGRCGEIQRPYDLRTATSCFYKGEPNRYIPAMLAVLRDAESKPVTIHRTYLSSDGGKADVESPRRMMPGSIPTGSAVRLCGYDKILGIAEGIETALSAQKLFDVPVWAALNTTLMAKWRPPKGVSSVIIFADNDHNFAGQKAASDLAHKISRDVSVEIKIPEESGRDWNDVLLGGRVNDAIRAEYCAA